MKVSACLVTRGDQEEGLQQIIESIPEGWEIVIWDNGEKMVSRSDGYAEVATDLAVYGRYAAIEHASHDLIYVADDDCIVSDPQAIVDRFLLALGPEDYRSTWEGSELIDSGDYYVVCNMPQEFRPHYPDSGLVGFGAAFHRDAPEEAFASFWEAVTLGEIPPVASDLFNRRADNVFTTLTPRVLVDVPKTDCIYASDSNRMWRQQTHTSERDRMIELARQVRDA